MVKRFMRDASRETEQYRGMPIVPEEFRPKLKLVGKAIVQRADEMHQPPCTQRTAANCGADLMQANQNAAIPARFRVCAGLRPECDCPRLHEA